ncbi:MAG TPA: HAMP domain-containing sensor histidine kinase [Pyrinomonadaceae bacterium]|nr:HAMP domain-containing sensor histidine kinase [Pyrinomonadaceae bacterium]
MESLSREIVKFFHEQTFVPNNVTSVADVCRAFSDILLRHWELDAIVIYLRADAGEPMREYDVRIAPGMPADKAHAVCAMLAKIVEQRKSELRVWPDENDAASELKNAFVEAGLTCGIGVPIYGRDDLLVGIVVTTSAATEELRRALRGIRLIAELIIIAISNTHRFQAMREQRERIEHLVQELQKSNAALGEANHELQRISLYRSLFLARMSHELRTPLTSVLGFAEILLDQEKLTPTQQRFCQKIQSSGLQLQMSLKQLVDLSKLEAGQTELFLHEFSLRETLRESCSAVAHLAHKHEVKLDCQSPFDLPTIVSDEGKLRQVLYNFIAYAIGRSPAGGSVRIRCAQPSSNLFRLTISDEGEPVNDLNIFEPIDVGEPGASGTNLNELGLSIARRLIDVLSGTVSLDSHPPRGLSVTIELPQSPTKT